MAEIGPEPRQHKKFLLSVASIFQILNVLEGGATFIQRELSYTYKSFATKLKILY